MKLVRVMHEDKPVIGAMTDSGILDLGKAVRRYVVIEARIGFLEPIFDAGLRDPRALLTLWPVVRGYILAAAEADDGSAIVAHSLKEVRTLPFVPNPGKIIGLGYNYRTLCETEGVTPSTQPQLFAKMPTSVVGPFDDVIVPPSVTRLDFEAELCVIIGRSAARVTADEALAYVGAYTVMNDLTAKILPRPKTEGETATVVLKGADQFAPLGAVVVTPDELSLADATLVCRVNAVERQRFPVSDWVHDVATTVAYVSSLITLHPGDLISMGTSVGLGILEVPPRLLADGDVVECEIDGYPGSRNVVRLATSA